LKVNLTPQARDDLVAIRDWIAQDNERAAERVVSRILQTAMKFGQFPKLGRVGEVAGRGLLRCLGCRIGSSMRSHPRGRSMF
jgi:plasmid stabilization system protein ParE